MERRKVSKLSFILPQSLLLHLHATAGPFLRP
jgi:hypothetical protein